MLGSPSLIHARGALAWFLGIAVLTAVILAGLAWRLYEQDLKLERQRVRDRLEQGAELAQAALLRACQICSSVGCVWAKRNPARCNNRNHGTKNRV